MSHVAQGNRLAALCSRWVGEQRGSWALLLSYAVVLGLWLPNAGLETDDGSWLTFTHRFTSGRWGLREILFPRVPTGDRLVSNSLLPAALHALPYAVHRSVWTIYAWALLLLLAAHAVVLSALTDKAGRTFMQAASVLSLWTPAFCVYYGIRAWQLAYLPLAIAAMLWGMLRYAEHGKSTSLTVGMGAAALAVHAHPGALLLLPGVALAFYTSDRDPAPLRSFAWASASYLAILSPFVVYLLRSGKFLVPVALMVLLVVAPAARKIAPRRDRYLPWLAVALPFLLPLVIPFRISPARPLVVLLDLLGAPSGWAARRAELDGFQSLVPAQYTPASLCFLACVAVATWRYPRASARERVLWCLGVLPVVAFVGTSLRYGDFPHQRAAFLFPTAFVLLASVLLRPVSKDARVPVAHVRRLAAGAFSALALLAVGSSVGLEQSLSSNGGVGWHCASLGEKTAVLAYVRERAAHPRVIVVDRNRGGWSGCNPGGWDALLRDAEYACDEDPRNFYVMEPRSKGYDEWATDRVEALPRLSERTFRSVRVIESPVLRPELGTVLEPPRCYANRAK